MYTTTDFISTIRHEAVVLKHLAKQLKPRHLKFRFSPNQRSTLELLQYLTIGAEAAAVYATTGSWDHWDALAAQSAKVTKASFAKAIDAEVVALTKLVKKSGDVGLEQATTTTFAGRKGSLGAGLIEMVLSQLVAYRMQLFLQAKAAGLSHLATSDCWAGRKPKPKAKAKAKAKASKKAAAAAG